MSFMSAAVSPTLAFTGKCGQASGHIGGSNENIGTNGPSTGLGGGEV